MQQHALGFDDDDDCDDDDDDDDDNQDNDENSGDDFTDCSLGRLLKCRKNWKAAEALTPCWLLHMVQVDRDDDVGVDFINFSTQRISS